MKMTKSLTTAMIIGALTLGAGLVIANTHPKLHGGTACAAMDTDGNGSIDEQEFNTMRQQRQDAAPTFAQIDTNGDGLISTDEMAAMHQEQWERRGKGGRGHHGMRGHGMMDNKPCKHQAMDAETQKKYDAFMAATIELRKELAVKRAEKRAVMQAVNPDPEEAAQLTRELLELRAQMMAQAEEAGVNFGPGHGCLDGRSGKGGCGGGCR
jgi:zinc resistance-associated protein